MARTRLPKSLTEPAIESPIPFRTGCNGEFLPAPPTERDLRAEALFERVSDEKARRLGVSRREFVGGACGTATALWVINAVYGCGGDAGLRGDSTSGSTSGDGSGGAASGGGSGGDGGVYQVDAGSTEDVCKAHEELSGDDFIFDVQTHHVNPTGPWRNSPSALTWGLFFAALPQGLCGEADPLECFSKNHYLREMFVNSDTHVAALSAVPADPGANPLTVEEAEATRDIVQTLSGSPRVVLHGLVMPDRGQAELDKMQALAEETKISAWKVYTPYGSWRLDDEAVGIPFIERARSLGIKVICTHKGLPLVGFDPAFCAPDDVGVVAKAYSDVSFLVYHSAFDPIVPEGPYNPAAPNAGIDRLIRTLEDNAIGPGGNVYAELGSLWRHFMTNPMQAAHAIGKLLKHVGEDRIVWGTDSIWYGSPQDQIAAFRRFQIPEPLRDQHGYPEITPAIRAKIFGLNAATAYGIDPKATLCTITEDDLAKAKLASADRIAPGFRGYGPQTRREMLDFLRSRGGEPG